MTVHNLLMCSAFTLDSTSVKALAALAPPPGPKPPNKGRGHSFMDVPPAPTKSGNGRLTHPKALGFYFGPPVLTRNDHNPAHRSNWPPGDSSQSDM